MQLPVARKNGRALTASASQIRGMDSAYVRRMAMPWQERALYYCDTIGELHYASNFYARMLEKLRIFPALRGSDDTVGQPIEDGLPVEVLDRVQDPGGGRTAILRMYGKLMMITGEGFLFGRGLDSDLEKWTFVWREQLRFDEQGVVTEVLAPSIPYESFSLRDDANWEPLPAGSAVAYRMWTPHPRFNQWPDSPMRALLEESEELLVLSRSVMATAVSRLARAPLLVVPEEIAPPPINPEGDEDPLNDPFIRDLTQHLERALDDPASASALVPPVIYGGSEWLREIRTIPLHDTTTDYLERDLRKECVERIARGLDLPPEVVAGMSDANHWAAWWISDDMWRSHGAPIAEQFCDDLAETYLRPALREAGYEQWKDVVVGFDPSAVVVNPDRSKDADQAWDRGAIGYAAYRKAKNFKDDDAQSEEEHAEWLAMKKVITDPEGNPIPATGGGTSTQTAETIENPGDEPGTPDGQPGDVSEGTNLPASAARMLKVQGAAEIALVRCRELAGARLRSLNTKCPHCLEGVKEEPNHLVAAGLGRMGLEPLGSPEPRTLVRGGTDALAETLRGWGYSPEEASTICDLLEIHAARTLFQRSPAPPAGLL